MGDTIDTTATEVVTETEVAHRPVGIIKAVGDAGEAVREYRKVQQVLDESMPDCIMHIQGRAFRKKNYWRGVATAFGLDVQMMAEEKVVTEDDWGYLATYRATAPNGRHADGDGACFATEKPGRNQATIHNVRSHAHTRAMNRAISNLVGFGEVSADEINVETGEVEPPRQTRRPTKSQPPQTGRRQAPAPAAAPAAAKDGGAFDQPLGFGKHRARTWREMSSGSIGGERHNWLIWASENLDDEQKLERVRKCLAIYSQRADQEAAAGE